MNNLEAWCGKMMDDLSSMESDICPIECTVEFKKYYNTKNILEKADNYLRESEIFVQSELTLGKLALMLGTNRTYLSRAISQRNGFGTFLALYRIYYVAALLKDNEELHLEEAVERAGFKSLNTFWKRLESCGNDEIVTYLKNKYLYSQQKLKKWRTKR